MEDLKRLSNGHRLAAHVGKDLEQAAEISVSRSVELELSSQGEEGSLQRSVASDEDESLQRSVASAEEGCQRLKQIAAGIERNVEF